MVGFIYPALNPGSRTLQARLEFSNGALKLRPGMFADVAIFLPGDEEVLAVPAVNTPIYQTTTYRFATAADAAAYLDAPEGKWLYSRLENPTVIAAERKVALLEATESACCFASGMAAIHAALVGHLSAGDALLVADTIYGQTTRLARTLLARFGVEVLDAPLDRLAQGLRARPAGQRLGHRVEVVDAAQRVGLRCRHVRTGGLVDQQSAGIRHPARQLAHLRRKGLNAGMTRGMDEAQRPVRCGRLQVGQHRHHRRDADTGAQQHDRRPAVRMQEEVATGRREFDHIAGLDAIVEVDGQGRVVWEWWFFDHVIQDFDATKANYVGVGKTIALKVAAPSTAGAVAAWSPADMVAA